MRSPVEIAFEVHSISPKAEISQTSTYSGSSKTATSATVTYGHSTNDVPCVGTVHNYQQPWAEITISNLGNTTSASLTFAANSGGTVHLYTASSGTTPTSTYEWATTGSWTDTQRVCRRWVGYYKSNSGATDTTTAAGRLTSTQLTVSNGTRTAVFNLTNITINNPDAPK